MNSTKSILKLFHREKLKRYLRPVMFRAFFLTTLMLKVGAEVIFTKNNQKEGFSNGTLGSVVAFKEGPLSPIIRTKEGGKIVVEPTEWSVEENGKVKAKISKLSQH